MAKGQMSAAREKDQKENLEKCRLHSCSSNKRKQLDPRNPQKNKKPGACTDAELKGDRVLRCC